MAPWITKCTWIFIVANTLLKNLGGGWEETREKCKEIFWFLHTRVPACAKASAGRRERVRGALYLFTTQSGRTRQIQATTRSARAKWVRAKATISPQIETSESERWKMPRAVGAGVGKRCRRSATNWDGMGISKWADSSLVSSLKTNLC